MSWRYGCLSLCLFVPLATASAQETSATEPDPPAPSRAVDAAARDLFDRGTEAWDAGDVEDALSLWRQAHELAGWPRVLFNLGSAHDRLGHASEAIERYEAYLEAVPDAPNRAATERRLAELRRTQAARAPEGGGPEPVEPGAGTSPAGEAGSISGGEPRSVAASIPGPDHLAAGLLLGGSGLLALTAVGTGIAALTLRGELDGRCPDRVCDGSAVSDVNLMEALSLTTDVLFGLALTGAVIGAALILVAPSAERASASLSCGPAGCALSGRF